MERKSWIGYHLWVGVFSRDDIHFPQREPFREIGGGGGYGLRMSIARVNGCSIITLAGPDFFWFVGFLFECLKPLPTFAAHLECPRTLPIRHVVMCFDTVDSLFQCETSRLYS